VAHPVQRNLKTGKEKSFRGTSKQEGRNVQRNLKTGRKSRSEEPQNRKEESFRGTSN
jgi:hypothetical protein